MSSSGFTDMGYTNTMSNVYDSSNNLIQINQKIPGYDIFDSINRCGIFMINGEYDNSSAVSTIYPIYCTAKYYNINIPADQDDAYLVYPGWGFQLFDGPDYSGTNISKIYFNNTSAPIVFATNSSTWNANGNTLIQLSGSSNTYPKNTTASWKIYFRGTLITTGLTSTKGL